MRIEQTLPKGEYPIESGLDYFKVFGVDIPQMYLEGHETFHRVIVEASGFKVDPELSWSISVEDDEEGEDRSGLFFMVQKKEYMGVLRDHIEVHGIPLDRKDPVKHAIQTYSHMREWVSIHRSKR